MEGKKMTALEIRQFFISLKFACLQCEQKNKTALK